MKRSSSFPRDRQPGPDRSAVSRRGLLGALTLGGVGAALATTPVAAGQPAAVDSSASQPEAGAALGSVVIPFRGAHQAGIATPMQAAATFVALDLRDGVDREALVRLMVLLTDDIERLAQGRPALADPEPELATVPARMSATVGFGAGLLAAAGLSDQAPRWLRSGLPSFGIDKLQERWNGGDLLLQVAAEDPMTISHALRVLITDAGPFATVRWVQSGFHRPANTAPGGTGRNLMGQIDGTVNPQVGTEDFDDVVWIPEGPPWLVGGTALLIRRIAMDLRAWGAMDVTGKEESIGRRLADGAPLTGGSEFSAPDYAAVDDNGFLVIPPTAHMRRAHAQAPRERILRRPYNYDDGIAPDGSPDAGLLFVACMADPLSQYVPIQQRLADADVLNVWTTPIGSALFAVPRGVGDGEYLGQALLA